MLREQLDQVLSLEGWDPRDPVDLSTLTEAQRTSALEIASRYRRLFMENPDGRVILGILLKQTLMRPTVIPTEDPRADGFREGQAALVRGIMYQCELAVTGGAPTSDTNPSPLKAGKPTTKKK